MNNIIFLEMCNYSKGHCRCGRKLLQELPNELPLLWTAIVKLAYSRTQSVQGSVCRCFQDLEKLCKAQTTAWNTWKCAS